MFTKWHEVEDWISDNNITRWTFYRNNPLNRPDDAKNNDIIVSSLAWDKDENNPTDMSRKLELTKKYLEQYGERCYGIGMANKNASRGGLFCEVCLTSAQPANPVGFAPQFPAGTGGVDEAALTERIKKELRLEYDQRDFERERKQLDEEKRQFEADKASVMGAVIGYLKPYIPALSAIGKNEHRLVAGLDGNNIHAAKIDPIEQPAPEAPADDEQHDNPDPQDPEQEEIFTEESDKLFELMARFKKVEPDYLKLLDNVVKMAESGDATYTMARGFLLK